MIYASGSDQTDHRGGLICYIHYCCGCSLIAGQIGRSEGDRGQTEREHGRGIVANATYAIHCIVGAGCIQEGCDSRMRSRCTAGVCSSCGDIRWRCHHRCNNVLDNNRTNDSNCSIAGSVTNIVRKQVLPHCAGINITRYSCDEPDIHVICHITT